MKRSTRTSYARFVFLALVVGAQTASSAAFSAETSAAPLRALIVGGGPDPRTDAAQIEGHVHYVASLLPEATKHVVLFTDGKPDNKTVSYPDTTPEGDARSALSTLLPKYNLLSPVLLRPPQLGVAPDGPSSREAIHRAVGRLLPKAGESKSNPLLLYFAGHGGPNGDRQENTQYDLWDDKSISVHDLSTEIARLSPKTPVVLVMAQCFSGAFANLLYYEGKPGGKLVPQNLVGFFSAQKDREASGCDWSTGEEDYQDFSSYFFGALCGYNRFGHPVQGADADGNGVVTLHEAFCYALGHDDSIDTPVCTSDIFLRRFGAPWDGKVYETPYAKAWQTASPAQRAALDTLSQKLGLAGDDRALAAHDRLTYRDPLGQPDQLAAYRDVSDKFSALCQTTLATLFKECPGLRWNRSRDYNQAEKSAVETLAALPAVCHDVEESSKALDRAQGAIDNDEAYLRRFLELYGSVVLAERLREQGAPATKANFERLWQAEQQSLPLRYPHPTQ
jgi:hypothetical protein